MIATSQFKQAGKYACILFDKTFKVTLCKQENEDLLREIIELLIPGKHIAELKLERNELSGFVVSEKTVIFDLLCTDADTGEKFVVEMQFAEQHSYQDRMLCYATYPIREQLALKLEERRKGDVIDRMDYTLKPVYVISLVNFALPHESPEALEDNGLISRYSLRNDNFDEAMTDALHFVYLELGRLPYSENEASKCKTLLEKFAFSLKYIHTMTRQPEAFDDPLMDKLFKVTELASMTMKERDNYEKEMRTQLDIIAEKQFAREKGWEEGREEGRQEGRQEALKSVVANLKKMGLTTAEIAKATALPEEQVRELA